MKHENSNYKIHRVEYQIPFGMLLKQIESKIKMAIKIAIIEDDDVLLSNFKKNCQTSAHLDCVFAVDSTEKLMKYFSESIAVDVAVVDLSLQGLDGFEAVKHIKKISPKTEILIFSTINNYEATFKALRLGAVGYLVKSLSFEEIEEYIVNLVEKGTVPLSPPVARRILEYFQPSVNKKLFNSTDNNLTPKEILVIKHFIQGKTYQETADLMGISESGVRFHIRNIYKKLRIKSKGELINLYVNGFFKKFF